MVEVVVDLVASRRRYLELITVLAITVSLWYSVAVGVSGVYRPMLNFKIHALLSLCCCFFIVVCLV